MVQISRRADNSDVGARLSRLWLMISCTLMVFSVGFAQSGLAVKNNKEDSSVLAVKNLLQQPSGFSSGFSEKQSDRLGDRVSIALLKIFKGKELKDPQNIKTFLPIIRAAFLYPNLVPAAYRKPRVTLPFLARLEQQAKDPQLKSDISEVIRFVKEQTLRKT